VAALGRRSGGELIDEKTAWQYDPLAPRYSYSKFQAEREIWRGQAEGLSVAAVYPSLIFGSGWWKAGTNQLFAHADRELPFYPPGATGMVDVRDVARAILLLMNRDRDGDRFLLNGENISYQALLQQMAAVLGRQAPRRPFRQWQARLLLWAETLRSKLTGRTPLITAETIRNSFQRYGYNNQRSREELGLAYIPAAETLAETAAQYLASKATGKPADVLPLR
jgi:nucleoside-diphosphate-sugar epimerase